MQVQSYDAQSQVATWQRPRAMARVESQVALACSLARLRSNLSRDHAAALELKFHPMQCGMAGGTKRIEQK